MKIKEFSRIENIKNELGNVIGKRFHGVCIDTEVVRGKHPCKTIAYLNSQFINTEYAVKIEYFKNKEIKTSHFIGQDESIIHDILGKMEKQFKISFFENGLFLHWKNSIKINTCNLKSKYTMDKRDFRDGYREAIKDFWNFEFK
jgi:hypothetical protein